MVELAYTFDYLQLSVNSFFDNFIDCELHFNIVLPISSSAMYFASDKSNSSYGFYTGGNYNGSYTYFGELGYNNGSHFYGEGGTVSGASSSGSSMSSGGRW